MSDPVKYITLSNLKRDIHDIYKTKCDESAALYKLYNEATDANIKHDYKNQLIEINGVCNGLATAMETITNNMIRYA